jgi:hypothetical protein
MPLNETACDTCSPATSAAAAKLIDTQPEVIRRLAQYFDALLVDDLRFRRVVEERKQPAWHETVEMTRQLECEATISRARVDLARSLFEHELNEAVFKLGDSLHAKQWAYVQERFADKAARGL